MNEQNGTTEQDNVTDEKTESNEPAGEGEFKITVKKLELPVRPRGVLAE
jgi:hypothetical protein